MRLLLLLLLLSTQVSAVTLEARPQLAVEINTPTTQGSFRQAHKLLIDKKYFASIKTFKQVIKDTSYPLLDYAYFFSAQAYKDSKYPKEAIQVYKIVTKYFKDSILAPKALLAIAECRRDLKDYPGTAVTLRELIARYPQHELIPQARYLLGYAHEQQKQYIKAAQIYRNLDLSHRKSYFAEKALERLDNLAKRNKLANYEAPAASIYNLGVKYFERRNYVKAKEYFSRLTRFYKKSSFYDEAIYMQGRLHLRKNRLKSAKNYFNQAIKLNQDSQPIAMYHLALTYAYDNDYKTAIKTLNKIVELHPKSFMADDALYRLGEYYKKDGLNEQAIAAYSQLVINYPDSNFFTEAIWASGNSYYKAGNYQAAYDNLSQAFKLPPDKVSDRLLFWAGKSAAKLGLKAEAIKAYKTTVKVYDHSYYGYRAREELEKFNIKISTKNVPNVLEQATQLNGNSHEKKYNELLALGLADEAAEEASFLVEKVPLNKRDKVLMAKYHAYIMKGKYGKPIHFADKKLTEAMYDGALNDIDPKLWRFAYPRGYWTYVEKYAKEFDLDPYLVYAVIREESRFKSRALSHSWAHGLMQIIPSTGRIICRKLGLSYSRWKMYNPRVNIRMGSYYLASLIKRFDGNVSLAVAGYNGGPVRIKKWTKKYPDFDLDEFVEDIPITETRNYVKKVMKSFYGYQRTYGGNQRI